MSRLSTIFLLVITVCSEWIGSAVEPMQRELSAAKEWFERSFPSRAGQRMQSATLNLVYEDSSDGITRGRSWRGGLYQIGSKTYGHGIAFNATKHVRVSASSLPKGPLKLFVRLGGPYGIIGS